ncbi:MAG: hypothetical protein HYW78_04495 [Parcubacteria group bacterium]|nr:hypothetical protein [Parcubacteria group bacterium]
MEKQEIKTINDTEIEEGISVDDMIEYLVFKKETIKKGMYSEDTRKKAEDLLFKMKVLGVIGRYKPEEIKETEKWIENDKVLRQLYDKVSILLNGVKKLKEQGAKSIKICELREAIIDNLYIKIFSNNLDIMNF